MGGEIASIIVEDRTVVDEEGLIPKETVLYTFLELKEALKKFEMGKNAPIPVTVGAVGHPVHSGLCFLVYHARVRGRDRGEVVYIQAKEEVRLPTTEEELVRKIILKVEQIYVHEAREFFLWESMRKFATS